MELPRPASGAVFIVDSDPGSHRELASLLGGVQLQIETFSEPGEFLQAAAGAEHGCAIIDACMSGMTGLQIFDALKRQESVLSVILVSGTPDVLGAVMALKRGVFDYQVKPVSGSVLLQSVYDGAAKSAELYQQLKERRAFEQRLAQLTPRETQVLELVIQGLPSKQIGSQLGLRQKTVEAHRTSIMEKLGVCNVAELVRNVVSAM
jgi:RNA polymerase sigma factor (sigma-70 family)